MNRYNQKGFTLLEILVALTLGLVVSAGVIQIFISSKSAYRVEEALSRVQENGRNAIDFIARDLRSAGFTGCLSILGQEKITNTLNNSTDFLFNFGVSLAGFEATGTNWTPALDTSLSNLSNPPWAGTDVITIRSLSRGLRVTQHNDESADIKSQDARDYDIQDFDILLVFTCESGAVFQATSVNTQNEGGSDVTNYTHNTGSVATQCVTDLGDSRLCPGNATKNLGSVYFPDGQIARAVVYSYYIAEGEDPNLNGIPSLWRYDHLRGTTIELVEGIENMQILYGVDTDDDKVADRFYTADGVTNWNDVVSTRVSFLTQTIEDNVAVDTPVYTYNGASVTATDRRLRRVYTTSTAIRNRLQ